uniref:Uncharacterized protein n=2 Tax=Babesia bovis TaxID=5865 RepID=A7AX88_BABBO|eukprot:XP_001608729.1 hypothetical protein [Babesia bovis T2Bo]
MFQHGPEVDFGFHEHQVHIQVSNIHDLLFVGQCKTLYIYKLSAFASSVVSNEAYSQHLLDRIECTREIEKILINTERNCLAIQSINDIDIYDFSIGTFTSEAHFNDRIVRCTWSKNCILVLCSDEGLYSVSLTGSIRTLLDKCSCLSDMGTNGSHAVCRFQDAIYVQVFDDVPSDTGFTKVELPEGYDDSQVTHVAGCHLLRDGLVAIGIVIDNQDSLILFCEYLNDPQTIHYAFNELYLTPSEENVAMEFMWVDKWQCLFAMSNWSTMVVIMSNHPNLVPDNQWHVLNMKEGCGLETVDIDCYPTELVICTSYRDTVYRKNCDVDSPLLTNPCVFLMSQGCSKVTLNYADIWSIDQQSNEIEKLPTLIDGLEGQHYSRFQRYKAAKITETGVPEVKVEKTSSFGMFNMEASLTVENYVSSVSVSSTAVGHSTLDMPRVTHSESFFTGYLDKTQKSDFILKGISRKNSIDELMEPSGVPTSKDSALIDDIYRNGIKDYLKLNVETNIQLQRMRLIEMLCNTFQLFEQHLQEIEQMDDSPKIEFIPPKTNEWTEEINSIKNIQADIVETLNKGVNDVAILTPDDVSPQIDTTQIRHQLMDLFTTKIRSKKIEVPLDELENAINSMNERLLCINKKLDQYEEMLDKLENERILQKVPVYNSRPLREEVLIPNDNVKADIDNLINQLRATTVSDSNCDPIEYKHGGPVYTNYDALAKRVLSKSDKALKSEGTSTLGTIYSDDTFNSSVKYPSDVKPLFGPSSAMTSTGSTSGFSFSKGVSIDKPMNTQSITVESTKSDHSKELMSNTTKSQISDNVVESTGIFGKHTDGSLFKEKSDTGKHNDKTNTDDLNVTFSLNSANIGKATEKSSVSGHNSFFSSSVINSDASKTDFTGSGFKLDAPKQLGDSVSSFGQVSPLSNNGVLQHQSYSFSDIGASGTLKLDTGPQIPLPSTNQTTSFATYASGSTMTFTDLALSQGNKNSFGITTSPFGSSGFGNAPATGGFTGLSGFKTGSFQTDNNVKPSGFNVNTLLGSSATSSGGASNVAFGGFRRSDPLD